MSQRLVEESLLCYAVYLHPSDLIESHQDGRLEVLAAEDGGEAVEDGHHGCVSLLVAVGALLQPRQRLSDLDQLSGEAERGV